MDGCYGSPVVVCELGPLSIVGVEADSPDLRTHELDQEEGVIIEAKDGSMTDSRVGLAVVQQLVFRLEGYSGRLLYASRGRVKALEEVIGFDKDVRISELGSFEFTHFGHE